MDSEVVHQRLMTLELESTKLRYTTFTAVLSISFLLPGLALRADGNSSPIHLLPGVTLQQLVFLLGFLFYCFAAFHYAWHHRQAHIYRRELKRLEKELRIRVYRLRARPKLGPFKLHFDRAIWVIGVAYGLVVCLQVGWVVFVGFCGGIVGLYGLLTAATYWQSDEPLEG